MTRWLTILTALLLTAACGEGERPARGGEMPAVAAPEQQVPGDTVMAQREECVNRAEGYAVDYPAGWEVNAGEPLGPCSVFHPGPIQVPRDSEFPLEFAVVIGFEAVPFAQLTGEMLGRREVAREPTTVDGREAVRIESETTGEGLHDAGIRTYQYFVDLGDTTMIASTYDVGEPPFERKRQILDAMMRSFDFREPE